MIRRESRDRGQTLAEFALVLPVLLLLLMAVFDFGRAIYAFNTVSNAARAGARVAIVDQNSARIEEKAVAQAISMNRDELDIDFVGPSTSCPGAVKIGCPVSVTVTYQWSALTPIIGNLIGPIELASTTSMPIERIFTSP